ncbi:MAG: hypothetical protein ACK4Z5_00300 [Brevundimonas sp.]
MKFDDTRLQGPPGLALSGVLALIIALAMSGDSQAQSRERHVTWRSPAGHFERQVDVQRSAGQTIVSRQFRGPEMSRTTERQRTSERTQDGWSTEVDRTGRNGVHQSITRQTALTENGYRREVSAHTSDGRGYDRTTAVYAGENATVSRRILETADGRRRASTVIYRR